MSEDAAVYDQRPDTGLETQTTGGLKLKGSFAIQAIEDAISKTLHPTASDWLALLMALGEHKGPFEANDTEIEGLPPAPMTPIRDMVCAIRVEQKKMGSIYLPDDAIQSQICRVLSVGPGLMLDDGVIREAPCKRGDTIFTTPGDGFLIKLNGEEFWIFEAMECVAILEDENATGYGTETCLNE